MKSNTIKEKNTKRENTKSNSPLPTSSSPTSSSPTSSSLISSSPISSQQKRLIEENILLARKCATKYTHCAYDREEVFAIASLALVQAALSYSSEKEIAFSTYAWTVMRNKILGTFKNHDPLNTYHSSISYAVEERWEEVGGGYEWIDDINSIINNEGLIDDEDMSDRLISNEWKRLIGEVLLLFKEKQQHVIARYLTGTSAKENAEESGMSVKNVYRIVRRFKEKMEEYGRRNKLIGGNLREI